MNPDLPAGLPEIAPCLPRLIQSGRMNLTMSRIRGFGNLPGRRPSG